MVKPTETNTALNTFGHPVECAAHYADVDREMVAQVIDWLNAQNEGVTDKNKRFSQSWLARLSRLDPSTINQVLRGKYPTSPRKQLKAMLDAIADHERKATAGASGMPYVTTGVYKLVRNTSERARSMNSFAVVAGFVGVGKTAAAKHYASEYGNTYLIEANPSMTASVLLNEIMAALKIGIHPRYGKSQTMDARFASIVEDLRNTATLLLIDEAETMSHKCLHQLRRIRDKANIGIVLLGTEKLDALIAPEHGEFDQIRSRVCMWPNVIKSINRKDADALAQAAFDAYAGGELGELSDDVLTALWGYCKGSARMLVENLIPSVRDFGLKKGEVLDASLVHDIAKQVLNLRGV